jgi:hypothetical protein
MSPVDPGILYDSARVSGVPNPKAIPFISSKEEGEALRGVCGVRGPGTDAKVEVGE